MIILKRIYSVLLTVISFVLVSAFVIMFVLPVAFLVVLSRIIRTGRAVRVQP